jgi:hypothetical protein
MTKTTNPQLVKIAQLYKEARRRWLDDTDLTKLSNAAKRKPKK